LPNCYPFGVVGGVAAHEMRTPVTVHSEFNDVEESSYALMRATELRATWKALASCGFLLLAGTSQTTLA
jgi:hypothetical protein